MSKRDKLRRKLKNNPKGRTKQEIITLLGYFGFILDHITGSHHVFRRDEEETMYRIVIPMHGQQVKPIYVKQVLERIDELFPIDEENDDE